ncbi:Asp23/Gls24 family envelope stress response protein [Clavibacter nebraskensis]|uniref:Asp23/Gls24 family envelope stress response protein n=1 Tax=Clavibacter nebraskensis TaxID=31963 RepID=UPI00201F8B6B|nr:Asp23/Gls24 family envelope stress response protein [Clavibacter nebraskensis]
MAMSGTGPGGRPALHADGAPLDMAALADYLDRGRTPRIAAYEDDPETRNALRALEHMRDLGRELVEVEAEEADAPGDDFFRGVLAHISRESRAGRDIPLSHPDPAVRLALTEGAVRTLVRQAGDEVPGVLVGRCTLDGDVTRAGEPVRVALTLSVVWGGSAARARAARARAGPRGPAPAHRAARRGDRRDRGGRAGASRAGGGRR